MPIASAILNDRTCRPRYVVGKGAASVHCGRRLAVRLEVLPDLLEDLRIDDAGVAQFRTLFRIEHERHGSALRAEGGRVEHVEAFLDRGGLRDLAFQLEGVDRRYLGSTAQRAQSYESRLVVFEGR